MKWLDNLKTKVKHTVPQPILNSVLLTFPFLYRTKLIKYETNLESGIDELLAQLGMVIKLDGSIIECGSTYCGTSIIMAGYARSIHASKVIYAYDSFEGFDCAELEKERKAGLVNASDKAFTITSYEYVKRKIKRLGFEGVVVPVKGYFEQTLPNITGKFCFALIDCDLRDSIVYCAERIWPDLNSGGRIVIDDYTDEGWKGARLGVDFFTNKYRDEISEHGLLNRLYFVCKK
jgi:hypothetical protein